MSFEELRDILGQRDNNGKRMPIIVDIFRSDSQIGHTIIVDYIREVDRVEYIDIRDPYHGERYSVSRDDFVELWQDAGITTVPKRIGGQEAGSSTNDV